MWLSRWLCVMILVRGVHPLEKKIGVHHAEDAMENTLKWCGRHKNALQLVLSGMVMLYGGRYAHAMLLLHTLKVTSGPLLLEAFRAVLKSSLNF